MALLWRSFLVLMTVCVFVGVSAEPTQLDPAEREAFLQFLPKIIPSVPWTREIDPCSTVSSDLFDIGCHYKDDDGLNHITKLSLSCGSDYEPEPPTHSNSSHYSYNFTSFKYLSSIFVDNCFAGTRFPTFSSAIEELEFNNNRALAVPLGDINLNCPGLKRLILTGNGFYGEIPDGFGKNWVNLQELRLSGNNLSGKIPSSLADLKLRTLDLSYNNFEGGVPIEFVPLANNSTINLQNNNLSGSVPFCTENGEKLQLGGNPGLENLKSCSKAVLPNAVLVSGVSTPLLVAPYVPLFLGFLIVFDL